MCFKHAVVLTVYFIGIALASSVQAIDEININTDGRLSMNPLDHQIKGEKIMQKSTLPDFSHPVKSEMQLSRYERGWEKLKEIDGEAGEKVIQSLKDVSPDLCTYIIEYAFGDVYSRTGLDLKSKEIAVVAALTAMGNAQPQLKVHINGALNTGTSINELKEVILQMSGYSGFPSSINAMNMLKDVLEERKKQGILDEIGKTASKINHVDRLKLGEHELSQLDRQQVDRLKTAYAEFSPELLKFILEYGYADIYARDNLNKQYRQIATIAALTALGTAQPQLKFHIHAGLNVGLSETEIKEIMLLMSVYSGFPSAINGTNVLKQVLAERIKN